MCYVINKNICYTHYGHFIRQHVYGISLTYILIMCVHYSSCNLNPNNHTNCQTKVKSVTETDIVKTTKPEKRHECSQTIQNVSGEKHSKDHKDCKKLKNNFETAHTVEDKESLSYSEESVSHSLQYKEKKKKPKKHDSEDDEDFSLGESDSVGFESDEVKLTLGEGEEFLDFSDLAKMKSLPLENYTSQSSLDDFHAAPKENPLLNWTCSPISLQKEQNLSSGFLDKRISNRIERAEDYPDGGTELIEDMQEFYCYLKHVNQLVAKKERRGKALMRKLVEEDPEFTQIQFDTEELGDHFSWVEEEVEAFEKIMDGICYQWKCLVARYTQKKH